MKEDVIQATYQGVTDAKKIEERSYRELGDSGIAVSRGGRARLGEDDYPETENFPFLIVPADDGVFRLHMPAAVATAWLTKEERDAIRAEIPADAGPKSDIVKEKVRALNVWSYAITHVARTAEEDLIYLEEVPMPSLEGKDVRRHGNVSVENYRADLYEPYRPPSKGGNKTALHIHKFTIDGEKYSFFGRGRNRFIFQNDTASFDYVVTDEGYRNVLQSSIITKDVKGKIVRRGQRGWKAQLRTAQTRPPASRREMRD